MRPGWRSATVLTNALNLAEDHSLSFDVCIVGAGPAGLTLARELAGFGYQVCILEAGPEAFDSVSNGFTNLAESTNSLSPRSNSRWGAIGGTATIWNPILRGRRGGRYLWLDEVDFERRPWLPYSGWPFSRVDLAPYYRRAEQTCMPGRADPPNYHPEIGEPTLELDSTVITTTVDQFDYASVFTKRIPSALVSRPDITVLTNATACAVVGSERRRVDRITGCSAPGRRFSIKARLYVLAAGGIENARLLLDSARDQGDWLGNAHGVLGRFFMDHHRVNGGRLVPLDP
jgi:choline dehydrogenase-like flavoprotein